MKCFLWLIPCSGGIQTATTLRWIWIPREMFGQKARAGPASAVVHEKVTRGWVASAWSSDHYMYSSKRGSTHTRTNFASTASPPRIEEGLSTTRLLSYIKWRNEYSRVKRYLAGEF